MRNRTNYENAVKESALCTANSHQTGVIKSCLLNLYKYFHISENLILDAMHDFLEGVPFMIKLLLKELYLEIIALFLQSANMTTLFYTKPSVTKPNTVSDGYLH